MSETIRLIPASRETEWDAWLAGAYDVYHTASYHRFSEQQGEGEALLAVYGDRERWLAWPYLLRPLDGAPGGLCDVTSVYGYAGPLAAGCSPGDGFLERARAAIFDLWRSERAVTGFTRFHPLLDNRLWASSGAVAEGETVSIDLGLGEAANWSGYQASLRNRINRGRRLGLATEVDESWCALDDFYRFYRTTMERNQAGNRYWFPLEYFQGLRLALGRRGSLLVTRLGADILAAGIFAECGGTVENLFSMNNPDWLEVAPTKVLLDDARRWARQRGNRVFHLGGGRGSRADSLFAFKAAFSPSRHRFYTGRWILDEAAYRRLCGPQATEFGGFFPAYRAAATSSPGRN